MERIVIVAYKPHLGKEAELRSLMETHWSILNKQGLVSDRKPITCQSADGSFIEVFGWKSKEAIEQAHGNSEVQAMWGKFAEVCEYIPIGNVAESSNLFSEFETF